ncbi:bifunctional precorrin-2 dehydrogenase/sirohydrochlorin ferrochelatase [Leptospira sp. 96542]|nr:bifunctional precorrin-2 dehydrogenase/sirohydrochlorin ferrochelatase [Leptospira sp. 96542]
MSLKKYPAFLNLENRNVLIIGAGNACLEKLFGLDGTGAKIHVISLFAKKEVQEYLEAHSEILYEERIVKESDFLNRDLIFLATSDSKTNLEFKKIAKKNGVWINAVDDPKTCDFYSASLINLGPVQFSISTDGKFAGISSTLRKLFEEILPEENNDLFETIYSMRNKLKTILPNTAERRAALKEIISDIDKKYFHK